MNYLSKLLPLFVLPIGITLLLIGFGIARRRRWPLVVAIVVLWLSSMPLVAGRLARTLEKGATRLPVQNVGVADAIVVLSTGRVTAPGPEAVSEWTDADRFFGGVQLLRAGKAPLLVFTGGWSPWEPNAPTEGDVMTEYATAIGIPKEQIVTTGKVFNTAEEAVAVAAVLKARLAGTPRIILVTSAFHVPRARQLFEQAGLTVSTFPVDFYGTGGRGVSVMDVLPTAGALAQTQMAVRELYGRAYYRFKPW